MSPSRLGAIVRADFLIRFRRLSTLVVFLLISLCAYLWIPDPSTGRALLVINGQRAVYNSAAIGMGTASVGAILIALLGYYVISNAIGRDVSTRCGAIIASTETRSLEYLFGKFLGNVAFLAVFTAGFMLVSMAMLLVRAEASLEVGAFVKNYLFIIPPAIVFVSVLAVVFESTPLLSGRFGDVGFFFLWLTTLGVTSAAVEGGLSFARYFDYSGFAFMFEQLKGTLKTESVAIGSSSFDPSKPPFVFPGLVMKSEWVLPRVISLVSPIPLLLIGRLFFHRFDPARVKSGRSPRRWRLFAASNRLVAPLVRALTFLAPRAGGRSIAGQAWTDAMLTITLRPVSVPVIAGFSLASLLSPSDVTVRSLLPLLFAVMGLFLADIACREERSGTAVWIYAAPHVRERFAVWKLLSVLFTTAMWVGVPLLRVAVADPMRAAGLACGAASVAVLATFLAVATRNPKTFIVIFLTFMYVLVSDDGSTPVLDFAGFFAPLPARMLTSYLVATTASAIATHFIHRLRLRG